MREGAWVCAGVCRGAWGVWWGAVRCVQCMLCMGCVQCVRCMMGCMQCMGRPLPKIGEEIPTHRRNKSAH